MHLYLHIPFCKRACHYCDFHFSTNLSSKTDLVDALCHEIALRKAYLPRSVSSRAEKMAFCDDTDRGDTTILNTIYFGGGTPSLLTENELAKIFETIHQYFAISPGAEITLEANPDDLTADKLHSLRPFVNRLSIGIQTFDEATLRWMNRAHNATEAERCVALAQDAGFSNLSVDLIYGIPRSADGVGAGIWPRDLEKIVALGVNHISAYALTIEPDTAFSRWTETGKLPPLDENLSAEQAQDIAKVLTANGYEHYEISSFGKPGHHARHNTAYWKQRPYLGIGPSAHSYNGSSRQYNVANNALYVKEIAQDNVPATVEQLTPADHLNEYLLTGLRTMWGCSLTELNRLLGLDFEQHQAAELAGLYGAKWLLKTPDNRLLLTDEGQLFADRVAATLFVD
jgi:oxygen-independent coproporphyrinogen III oxidase